MKKAAQEPICSWDQMTLLCHAEYKADYKAAQQLLEDTAYIADSLEFDVEIRLKPREGGKVLEAQLR